MVHNFNHDYLSSKLGDRYIEMSPAERRAARDTYEAERQYAKAMGKLEGFGLDPEVVDGIEEEVADLSAADRARHVQALVRGLELRGTEDNSGDKRPGGRRHQRFKTGGGGTPPPAPRASDYPETFEEFEALQKNKPEKAKALLQDPSFDLAELLRDQDAEQVIRAYGGNRSKNPRKELIR